MKIIVKILFLILGMTSLSFLVSCADDEFAVNFEGKNVIGFSKMHMKLGGTSAEVNIFNSGFISCTFMEIQYNGLTKSYSFYGYLRADTSLTVFATSKDTLGTDLLKIEAKLTGIVIEGKIYYCFDSGNCNFVEIGHITGYIRSKDNYFGFYYSPLFFGQFEITPSEIQTR